MCVNSYYITNKFSGKQYLVSCGKCEACQQEKAALRANRIRANMKDGYIALFTTLTYGNQFVPYLYRHELNGTGFYTLHRDSRARILKDGSIVEKPGNYDIDDVYLTFSKNTLYQVPDLRDYYGRVGFIYYPDFQDFLKRLRQKLILHYGIYYKISYFGCAEYGGKTFRPHFHALIFCKREDEAAFRSAIAESWLYDYCKPKRMRTTIARDCANYCASYVNRGASFPQVLSSHDVRPHASYSKYFGSDIRSFSLNSILEKVFRGSLDYSVKTVKDGVPCFSSHVVPEYVVNRYFPKFKGYCRLAPDEIRKLLLFPERERSKFILRYRYPQRDEFSSSTWYWNIKEFLSDCKMVEFERYAFLSLRYDDDDWHEFITRLNNAYGYYWSITGKSRIDYVIDFMAAWSCHASTVLKYSFMEDGEFKTDFSNHYENISDVVHGFVKAPTLIVDDSFQLDPNKRKDIVRKHYRLLDVFHKTSKNKRVVNYALSEQGYLV